MGVGRVLETRRGHSMHNDELRGRVIYKGQVQVRSSFTKYSGLNGYAAWLLLPSDTGLGLG